MSYRSSIEWTDATWNPIRGVKGRWSCAKVSTGCQNCYAEAMNVRFGGPRYVAGADELRLDEKALKDPVRWKKNRRVFVCSMTDLFEERVPDQWIDRVFAVMALAQEHTFQVLTKRANRMRAWFSPEESEPFTPLQNVWLGVSAEDQERADERIPLLMETPAVVRFVSAEPLLGPINLGQSSAWLPPTLDWVIVGGESGPHARPCDLAWIRSIRDQCRHAGVACFVKQDSGRWPGQQGRIQDDLWIKEWPDEIRFSA